MCVLSYIFFSDQRIDGIRNSSVYDTKVHTSWYTLICVLTTIFSFVINAMII